LNSKETPKAREADEPGLLKPKTPFLVADRTHAPLWK